MGDISQMAQLIRNLIDNAVKYGGRENPVVVIVECGANGQVAMSIVDQGEGISHEHLPRLTERFYRVDAARSRAAGGTGLGLAIVKHIVQRHRGQLNIESHPGVGTTVRIVFPKT